MNKHIKLTIISILIPVIIPILISTICPLLQVSYISSVSTFCITIIAIFLSVAITIIWWRNEYIAYYVGWILYTTYMLLYFIGDYDYLFGKTFYWILFIIGIAILLLILLYGIMKNEGYPTRYSSIVLLVVIGGIFLDFIIGAILFGIAMATSPR